MNKIIKIYTMCNDECTKDKHNSNYIVCSRCGSHIHTRIYRINTEDKGIIEVGSECFKDIMGYNFTKSHQKAIDLHLKIMDKIQIYKKMYPNNNRTFKIKKFCDSLILEVSNGLWVIEGKLNKTLINAGIDLNLWESNGISKTSIKITTGGN